MIKSLLKKPYFTDDVIIIVLEAVEINKNTSRFLIADNPYPNNRSRTFAYITLAYITFAYNVCHSQLCTLHLRTKFVIHSCVHHSCVQKKYTIYVY